MLLKHRVDWLGLIMALSEPLCLFPIYRARAVFEHWSFFSFFLAKTLNEQLEEQYAEFDKMCMGLISQTAP